MALTADRLPRNKYIGRALSLLVAANGKPYQGGLVSESVTGYAAASDTTAGARVMGMCNASVDNTGGADGAKRVPVETGVFLLDNDATHPVTQADVGRHCFVKDDHTVQTAIGGSTVIAGILEELDVYGRGVWVYVAPEVCNMTGGVVGTTADNSAAPGIPIEHVFQIADAADADYDLVILEKFQVIDVVVRKDGAGAGNTATVKNAANAISDAIVATTDKAITRAGTIDPAQDTIAAGGTLRVSVHRAAGSGQMQVTVVGRKVS